MRPRLSCLALCVIEIGGNCDNGLVDFLAKIVFRSGFQFLKNHCRNFRRRILLPIDDDPRLSIRGSDLVGNHLHFFVHFVIATSHESLDGVNGVLGIGDRLPLGDLSNEAFS
jgi:hypothetical protein